MGDTQKFLLEDIILYALMGIIDLTWDFWQNIFHATGLQAISTPYHFGTYQSIVLVFCLVQLIRKGNQWRYYK